MLDTPEQQAVFLRMISVAPEGRGVSFRPRGARLFAIAGITWVILMP